MALFNTDKQIKRILQFFNINDEKFFLQREVLYTQHLYSCRIKVKTEREKEGKRVRGAMISEFPLIKFIGTLDALYFRVSINVIFSHCAR